MISRKVAVICSQSYCSQTYIMQINPLTARINPHPSTLLLQILVFVHTKNTNLGAFEVTPVS